MSNKNTPCTHWALLSVVLGAITGCGGTVDPSQSEESLPIDTTNDPSQVDSTDDTRDASSMENVPSITEQEDKGDGPFVNEDFLAYDVFSTSGVERDIKFTSVDGSCEGNLVSTEADEKQPAFSADMTLLAYASNASGQYQIHLLDLVSGESRQLTTESGGATFPSFSPSGEQVAFVSGDPDTFREQGASVGVVDVANGAVRSIELESSHFTGFRAPTFSTESEILVGNAVVLLGLDFVNETERAVVPLTSRIPNPQDPSVAPDGERYVFTDYCNGGQQLFIGRVDGTTGDTCAAALPLDNSFGPLVSASWGPSGMIAAHSSNGEVVLLAEDGSSSSVLLTGGVPKNPEFASGTLPLEVVQNCHILPR